jgi:hypothetical protein
MAAAPLPCDLNLVETGYAQSWCMGSGSSLVLGVLNGLTIAEANALDDLAEAVGTVQPTPVALG